MKRGEADGESSCKRSDSSLDHGESRVYKHYAGPQVSQVCHAEFLVPEARLRDCWPEASQHDEPFAYIAHRFKASPLVAARRAQDLGLISRDEFFDFYNAYLTDERRTTGQGDGGGDFFTVIRTCES